LLDVSASTCVAQARSPSRTRIQSFFDPLTRVVTQKFDRRMQGGTCARRFARRVHRRLCSSRPAPSSPSRRIVGVVGCGDGKSGQNGLGTTRLSHDFGRIDFGVADGPSFQPGWQLACGLAHTMLYDGGTNVWAWGCGRHGRLGDDLEDDLHLPHVPFQLPSPVRELACGWTHTLMVLASGEVYAFGHGGHGALGLGDHESRLSPHRIPYFLTAEERREVVAGGGGDEDQEDSGNAAPVVKVAGGGFHSAALTADGELFTWGRVDNGRLGHGQRVIRLHEMLQLTGAKEEVEFSLGQDGARPARRTVVLRLPPNARPVQEGTLELAPRRVSALADVRIVDVSLGGFHSVAQAEDGTLYGFGGNQNGELAVGHTEDCLTPVRIPPPEGERVVQVACGSLFTLVRCESGRIYGSGACHEGQLGPGHPAVVTRWVRVGQFGDAGAPRAAQLVAGAGHSVAVTEEGEAFVWGANRFGALGLGHAFEKVKVVEQPTRVDPRALVYAGLGLRVPSGGLLSKLLGAVRGAGASTARSSGEGGQAESLLREALADDGRRICVERAAVGGSHTVLVLGIEEGGEESSGG